MVQKIEPYRLMGIYKEVYKFGIPFLETMTDYEILQIREFAFNVFKGGEESAFMLYSAYLNSNSDYLKQIPEEYKNGREIEYIGLKHVNHYYEAVHVLKTIEKYFELKQIKEKVESTAVENQILKKQETKFAEKYYSFFHLMLVHELRTIKEFERDNNDKYLKNDLIQYGIENYGTGQGFYRKYLDLYDKWNKKVEIAKDLGKGYKAKIIKISGNNYRIIEKLNDYPN